MIKIEVQCHRLPEYVAQKEEETDTDQSAYQIRVSSSPVMDHRQDIVDARDCV